MNNEINPNEELIPREEENLPTEEDIAPVKDKALIEASADNSVADASLSTLNGEEQAADNSAKAEQICFDGNNSGAQAENGSESDEFIFDTVALPSFEIIEEEEPEEPADVDNTELNEDLQSGNSIDKEQIDEELTDERKKKTQRERKVGTRGVDTAFDFLELFIFTLVGVLIVTSFLFRHSVVSGDSMQNTLQNGDRLIISNLFYEPEYGDIVVVEDREAGIASPIVKRVIALGGDTVRVTPTGIDVNGVALTEDYVYTNGHSYYYELEPYAFRDNETLVLVPGKYYEFVVPEGELFVLGDHRNNSSDSRVYGTVREDAVLGRLILRFFPFSEFDFFIFE